MPSLLASCEELFNSKDLYEVLGAEKTANSAQIKKAYHKVKTSYDTTISHSFKAN